MTSVFLSNLDDFIAPSQVCVNPFVSAKLEQDDTKKSSRKHGRVTIETEVSPSDFEDLAFEPSLIRPKAGEARKKATVSLNDCLACSGCVTSAEAVLVQEQSVDKFMTLLESATNGSATVVVQLSPNSQASIAEFLGWGMKDFFLYISAMLKAMGVKYVVDSSAGADVAIMECREEFVKRFKNGRGKSWTRPETTVAESSTTMVVYDEESPSAETHKRTEAVPSLASQLPVFTSHCPGWICYAEKTAPQALPYLSTVKSAQQVVGSIVKCLLYQREIPANNSIEQALGALSLDTAVNGTARANAQPSSSVFVVSVQPCFDKKLEASRRDFFHSAQQVSEVDLVLSTTELWQVLERQAFEWNQQRSGCGEDVAVLLGCDEIDVDFDDDDGVRIKRCKPHYSGANISPTAIDFMDLDSSTQDIALHPEAVARRTLSIHTAFAHVFDYLHSLTPDSSQGCDSIEALFRVYSLEGQKMLAAAERNMSSGGFVEYVFRYVAEQVYGVDLWNTPLVYKEGRNADIAEVDLASMLSAIGQDAGVVASMGKPLKFARAYGFRNVQAIMLKMKRGTCDFDFVELMACPSGCTNGGGQLKSLSSLLPHSGPLPSIQSPPRAETPLESKSRIKDVDQTLHSTLEFRRPEDSPLVKHIYSSQLLDKPLSEAARRLLHTRYHAVPKMETIAPLAIKW